MTELAYDAFISYRSTASAHARRIRAALEAVARRHDAATPFRAFLDTSSLRAGDLGEEINTALRASRNLLVLVARDTVESEWVDKEIAYWLSHGGSPDRLYLVRLDDVDLGWSESEGQRRFRVPEALPPALRHAFTREQNYVEIPATQRRIPPTDAARLYSAMQGVPMEALLLEEAARQRRTRRVTTAIAGAMAVLLVASIAAGGFAIAGQSAAQESQKIAEAEAAAAQSLLLSDQSSIDSIEAALGASAEAESASINAAMLHALGDTNHLIRTFNPSGRLVTDTALKGDDLAIIGDRDGVSSLSLHSVRQGSTLAEAQLANEAQQIHQLGARSGFVCGGGWPQTFSERDGSIEISDFPGRPTDVDFASNQVNLVCDVIGSGRDVFVRLTGYLNQADVEFEGAYTVGDRGLEVIDGEILGTKTSPGERYVYLLDASSSRLLDLETGRLAAIPIRETLAMIDVDAAGTIFAEVGDPAAPGFAFLRFDGAEIKVEDLNTQANVIAALPTLDASGVFTSSLITIDQTANIQLPGAATPVPIDTSTSQVGWTQFRPSLMRIVDDTYLAVFAQSASLLHTGRYTPSGDGWATVSGGAWMLPLPGTLGSATWHGASPFLGHCGRQAVLPAQSGVQLIGVGGPLRSLPAGAWTFDNECTLFETEPGLTALGSDEAGDLVLAGTSHESNWSSSAGQVATTSGSGPVSVHSLLELAPPWRWDWTEGGEYVDSQGNGISSSLTVYQDGEPAGRLELAEGAEFSAISPDGTSALSRLGAPGRAKYQLVGQSGAEDLPACDGAYSVQFLPTSGYEESADLAKTVVAAGTVSDSAAEFGESVVDCKTGEALDGWATSDIVGTSGTQLVTYEFDESGGRIVTTSEAGGERFTAWDSAGTITRRETSGTSGVGSKFAWSPAGKWSAEFNSTSGLLQVTDHSGGEEARPVRLPSALRPSLAAFLSEDGLLFVADREGKFLLLDAQTGFLVLDGEAAELNGATGIRATSANGYGTLHVSLPSSSSTVTPASLADGYLVVPIGREPLREALCAIHEAPTCGV